MIFAPIRFYSIFTWKNISFVNTPYSSVVDSHARVEFLPLVFPGFESLLVDILRRKVAQSIDLAQELFFAPKIIEKY